jgi:predicted nuclease of predicted toxin-antitoxin system
LLRRRGHQVIPVRRALAQNAADIDIAAYAAAKGMVIVTHDVGMARRARAARIQHLRFRVSEAEAEARLRDTIDEVEASLTGTALRVTIFKASVRAESA